MGLDAVLKLAAWGLFVAIVLQVVGYFVLQMIGYNALAFSVFLIEANAVVLASLVITRIIYKKSLSFNE